MPSPPPSPRSQPPKPESEQSAAPSAQQQAANQPAPAADQVQAPPADQRTTDTEPAPERKTSLRPMPPQTIPIQSSPKRNASISPASGSLRVPPPPSEETQRVASFSKRRPSMSRPQSREASPHVNRCRQLDSSELAPSTTFSDIPTVEECDSAAPPVAESNQNTANQQAAPPQQQTQEQEPTQKPSKEAARPATPQQRPQSPAQQASAPAKEAARSATPQQRPQSPAQQASAPAKEAARSATPQQRPQSPPQQASAPAREAARPATPQQRSQSPAQETSEPAPRSATPSSAPQPAQRPPTPSNAPPPHQPKPSEAVPRAGGPQSATPASTLPQATADSHPPLERSATETPCGSRPATPAPQPASEILHPKAKNDQAVAPGNRTHPFADPVVSLLASIEGTSYMQYASWDSLKQQQLIGAARIEVWGAVRNVVQTQDVWVNVQCDESGCIRLECVISADSKSTASLLTVQILKYVQSPQAFASTASTYTLLLGEARQIEVNQDKTSVNFVPVPMVRQPPQPTQQMIPTSPEPARQQDVTEAHPPETQQRTYANEQPMASTTQGHSAPQHSSVSRDSASVHRNRQTILSPSIYEFHRNALAATQVHGLPPPSPIPHNARFEDLLINSGRVPLAGKKERTVRSPRRASMSSEHINEHTDEVVERSSRQTTPARRTPTRKKGSALRNELYEGHDEHSSAYPQRTTPTRTFPSKRTPTRRTTPTRTRFMDEIRASHAQEDETGLNDDFPDYERVARAPQRKPTQAAAPTGNWVRPQRYTSKQNDEFEYVTADRVRSRNRFTGRKASPLRQVPPAQEPRDEFVYRTKRYAVEEQDKLENIPIRHTSKDDHDNYEDYEHPWEEQRLHGRHHTQASLENDDDHFYSSQY